MIEFKETFESHFSEIELRSHELKAVSSDPNAIQRLVNVAFYGVSSTLFVEGKILAIFGYYELWPGVINIWIFPSKYIYDHKLSYLKLARRYIKHLVRNVQFHRLQTITIADETHDKWMWFLGFLKEGTLEKYSPDKVDYNQWAIIKR